MKIKEISELTGLTKKTIRYYEAEGLLNPEKRWLNGREYRNYSQADVAQLEKIAALRRARFSVEEIRHIESVPADIPAVFQSYRQRLQREQRDLSAVLAVINNISTDDLTSEDQLIAEMRPATVGLHEWSGLNGRMVTSKCTCGFPSFLSCMLQSTHIPLSTKVF